MKHSTQMESNNAINDIAAKDENETIASEKDASVLIAPAIPEVQNTIVKPQTQKQSFPCPSCYKSFCRKTILNNHIPSCKKIQSPLQCPFCSKMSSSSGNLSKHKKVCKQRPQDFQDGHWIKVPSKLPELCLKQIRDNGPYMFCKWLIEHPEDHLCAFKKVDNNRNMWNIYYRNGYWHPLSSNQLAERLLILILSRLSQAYDANVSFKADDESRENIEDRISYFIMCMCNDKEYIPRTRTLEKINDLLNFSC